MASNPDWAVEAINNFLTHDENEMKTLVQRYIQEVNTYNRDRHHGDLSKTKDVLLPMITAAGNIAGNPRLSDPYRLKAQGLQNALIDYYIDWGVFDPNKQTTINKIFEQRDQAGELLAPMHVRHVKNKLLAIREELLTNISAEKKAQLTKKKIHAEKWLQQLYVDHANNLLITGSGTAPLVANGFAVVNQEQTQIQNIYYLGGYDTRPDYYPNSHDLKKEIDLLKRENPNRPLRIKIALGADADHMVAADIEVSIDRHGQEKIKAFIFNSWKPFGANPTESHNEAAQMALTEALGHRTQFFGNTEELQQLDKEDLRCGYWANWFLQRSSDCDFNQLTEIRPIVLDKQRQPKMVAKKDYPSFSLALERNMKNKMSRFQISAESSSANSYISSTSSTPSNDYPPSAPLLTASSSHYAPPANSSNNYEPSAPLPTALSSHYASSAPSVNNEPSAPLLTALSSHDAPSAPSRRDSPERNFDNIKEALQQAIASYGWIVDIANIKYKPETGALIRLRDANEMHSVKETFSLKNINVSLFEGSSRTLFIAESEFCNMGITLLVQPNSPHSTAVAAIAPSRSSNGNGSSYPQPSSPPAGNHVSKEFKEAILAGISSGGFFSRNAASGDVSAAPKPRVIVQRTPGQPS